MEALTNEIEEKSQEYLDKIDNMGGMLSAIEDGYIQREIQESSVRFQQEVYSGEKVFVGSEQVQGLAKKRRKTHDFFEVDSGVEDRQKAKLVSAQSRTEHCESGGCAYGPQ